MNWQIILCIFFICSATSTEVPENDDKQSSDGPTKQTSKSDENTSQNYNNTYKVDDQFVDKHLLEIPINNDCFSSIDMKKTIVIILESVRRSPEVLNNLIDKLKSEIDHEPGLVRANNNNDFDSRRSILLQLHLLEQFNSNTLSSTSPCARLISELAKSAHKTYMDFKNTPACMKYLLSENEATVNLDLLTKDTNPDVNALVSLILKELGNHDGLNVQKPGPTEVTVPENYFQNWNVLKSTMSVHPPTADKLGYQNSPSGLPSVNEPSETGIKQLTAFMTQSHASNTPLAFMPESLPESLLDSKPNRAPLPAFQPILTTDQSSPIMIQDPYFLVTNHGNKPQESSAQILEYTTTEHTTFGNYHDIFSTYSKMTEPAHDSLIKFPEKHQNGHDSVNIPKFVTNERPIGVENLPIQDLGYSVYPGTQFVYPTAKQPQYMDTTPILPKTNIVALIPELLRNEPSQNHIKTIKTALIQNKTAFDPNFFKTLIALLDSYEGGLVDNHKMYEIYKFLLQPHNILWSEEKRNLFWQLLQPNESGQINSRNIDSIISLIQTMNQGSLDKSKEFLPQSMLTEQEHTQALLNQNTKELSPDQEKIRSLLVESAKNDKDNYKYINIVNTLANLDKVPYLIAENINVIFSLLKPNYGGKIDARVIDIINQIILQKNQNNLTPEDIDVILSFLKPDVNGYVNSKRFDIVGLVLMNTAQAPQLRKAIIQLLDTDVVKSKYVDILLALYKERILSIQLLEAMITLLKQERTGYIDDYIINKIYMLLAPYKTGHPQIVSDIFRQLRTTRSPKPKPASAEFNANSIWKPDDMNMLSFKTQKQVPDLKVEGPKKLHNWEEYEPFADKVNSNDNLLFKLLPMPLKDPSAYTATLDKFGFLELTYMINKPVYRPMYYVKYKIPIDNFLTSLKAEAPQLSANPMMVLQKLIIEGNMSEVSPNLKGLSKDDILKMTFKDGDLVHAKLLDKPNLNLNDQIKIADNLNADSPQYLLEENNRNSAQSFHQIGGNVFVQPKLEYLRNEHSVRRS